MGNYTSTPNKNLNQVSDKTDNFVFSGINCQGWRKDQEDFIIYELNITRKKYISPMDFYKDIDDIEKEKMSAFIKNELSDSSENEEDRKFRLEN